MRNSYGPSFGMNGDMYVPRGGNKYNTETHITVFDVEAYWLMTWNSVSYNFKQLNLGKEDF